MVTDRVRSPEARQTGHIPAFVGRSCEFPWDRSRTGGISVADPRTSDCCLSHPAEAHEVEARLTHIFRIAGPPGDTAPEQAGAREAPIGPAADVDGRPEPVQIRVLSGEADESSRGVPGPSALGSTSWPGS